MTAEPAGDARRAVDQHVFLLAGQSPGTSHARALAAALRYGIAAEEHGFAGVWIAEHHFISYGVCPSAVTFAAHLLGRTSRVLVGTAVAVLSNRHPVALAEEAILLDELSGGRFALGVGRGGPWVDLEVFDTGAARFEHGFPESLDVVRAWLSGASPVGADGPHFRFRPVRVVPRPRRWVPLWVAATSSYTVDMAAARGLPLLLGMHATDAEKVTMLARYADAAARHGHDPRAVPHASAHLAYVDDTDAGAVAAIHRRLHDLLLGTTEYVRLDGRPHVGRDLAAYSRDLLETHPVGSPQRCRQVLAASAAATGVRHQLLMVEAAGDERATLDNIARLGEQVLLASPV